MSEARKGARLVQGSVVRLPGGGVGKGPILIHSYMYTIGIMRASDRGSSGGAAVIDKLRVSKSCVSSMEARAALSRRIAAVISSETIWSGRVDARRVETRCKVGKRKTQKGKTEGVGV